MHPLFLFDDAAELLKLMHGHLILHRRLVDSGRAKV